MNQSRVEPNKRTYFEIFIKTCYTCWTRDFECLCWMSEDLDTKVKKALSWSCTEELENNFSVNQVFTMAKGLTKQGYSYVMKLSWRFNSFASAWVVYLTKDHILQQYLRVVLFKCPFRGQVLDNVSDEGVDFAFLKRVFSHIHILWSLTVLQKLLNARFKNWKFVS